MSAPRDPKALARAKAKAAETQRRDRPLRELQREAEETGMHFHHSAPEGRDDLREIGRIIRLAGDLSKTPLDRAALERLRAVADALIGVPVPLGHYPNDRRTMAVTIDDEGLRELTDAINLRDAAARELAERQARAATDSTPATDVPEGEDVCAWLIERIERKKEGGAAP